MENYNTHENKIRKVVNLPERKPAPYSLVMENNNKPLKLNQPNNQPLNQPINQPLNTQFNNQPLNTSLNNNNNINNQPMNQPQNNQPLNTPSQINQPINSQQLNPLNPINQQLNQPLNNQPLNTQLNNQTLNPLNNPSLNNQPLTSLLNPINPINNPPLNNQPLNSQPLNTPREMNQPPPILNPLLGMHNTNQTLNPININPNINPMSNLHNNPNNQPMQINNPLTNQPPINPITNQPPINPLTNQLNPIISNPQVNPLINPPINMMGNQVHHPINPNLHPNIGNHPNQNTPMVNLNDPHQRPPQHHNPTLIQNRPPHINTRINPPMTGLPPNQNPNQMRPRFVPNNLYVPNNNLPPQNVPHNMMNNNPNNRINIQPQQQMQQQQHPQGGMEMQGPPLNQPPNPEGGEAPYHQEKFENALDFLDKVKLVFSKQLEVYNQFLDIMKDFKTKNIDTPGVIKRVKELFKGHPNLILGFNNFLPQGFKITLGPNDGNIIPPIQDQRRVEPTPTPIQNNPSINMPQNNPNNLPNNLPNNNPNLPNGPNNPGVPQRQPEFDHARNFVKKIKLRFSSQPQIYKSFLEILHTYHKDQHTINGVYNQVANLFKNHSDLLEEFAQFLPETLPQALRKRKTQRNPNNGPLLPVPPNINLNNNMVNMNQNKPNNDLQRKKEVFPINKEKITPSPMNRVPHKPEDLEFFKQLKSNLNNDLLYNDFIKCLSLYNNDIIRIKELLLFGQDIMSEYPHLFAQFKRMLKIKDTPITRNRNNENNKEGGSKKLNLNQMDEQEDLPPSQPFQEIDYMSCKRYGPSYRALPKNYLHPNCSGRKPEHQEFLNDLWVSIPTGTEDDGASFKASRKNQYEEVLFKCEDDRYELDLIIELNASCINFLEPIRDKIAETDENQISNFSLQEKLDILHQRAIERVYGEKGPEIIDSLYENTAISVPIVLSRLKQKDKEWRKARREWNKVWREVAEKNYYKALDHQSISFKSSEKKALSSKVLVAQIKQKYQQGLKNNNSTEQNTSNGSNNNTNNTNGSTNVGNNTNITEEGPSSHLTHSSSFHSKIFSDIEHLIFYLSENEKFKMDNQKLEFFFEEFVRPFYNYSPSLNQPKSESKNSNEETTVNPNFHFFGNRSFYLFFRFYCTLYERLEKAVQLEKEKEINSTTFYEFKFAQRDESNPNLTNDKKKLPCNQTGKNYEELISLIKELLSGNIDSTKFEEDCRELLGINCYVLFTIDRLVNQLCKQIKNIITSEFSSKLITLHNQENLKNKNFKLENYKKFASELFVTQGESKKRCFYFRIFNPSSNNSTSGKSFVINDNENGPQNISQNQTEMPKNNTLWTLEFTLLENLDNNPNLNPELTKEKWSRYIEDYVGNGDTNLNISKNKIFLIRNKRRIEKNFPVPLKNTTIINGLECKICSDSYKIIYVQDSSDYFKRKREPQNEEKKELLHESSERRKKRFAKWMKANTKKSN
eukprot:TRINITY_DN3141_c0_g1_i1.p1 TRINITY_DN3141_c0_g1~~TRINITY_DN3141_c0_g1_i1.p1  ORF type:complete len:1500 (-),score=471.01 TRINITY_DN3141_c0_g1_i1:9-4409(-)